MDEMDSVLWYQGCAAIADAGPDKTVAECRLLSLLSSFNFPNVDVRLQADHRTASNLTIILEYANSTID
jgi:hypothetical protein